MILKVIENWGVNIIFVFSCSIALVEGRSLFTYQSPQARKRNDPNCCEVLIIILIVTICRYPRERASTGIAAKLAQLIGHEKNHIFAILFPFLFVIGTQNLYSHAVV